MPGEVAWRGLSAQAQGVALPSSPGECRDPRSRSTCRAGPGSRAARERIRARSRGRSRARSHLRLLLTHLKVHSQNSQTFSAQRG